MSSIEIKGLEGVFKILDKAADPDSVTKGLQKACALVERSAKQNAHAIRDTGALSRSISSRVEGDTGIVFTSLEYAPYVEFGTGLFAENGGRTDVPWCYQDDKGEWHTTSGQKPQPFMRPALNDNRTEILRILKEALVKE